VQECQLALLIDNSTHHRDTLQVNIYFNN